MGGRRRGWLKLEGLVDVQGGSRGLVDAGRGGEGLIDSRY